MFEVASSKQIISLFIRTILKKFSTYFSPFDRLDPFYDIIKSALQELLLVLLIPLN